ncbi:HNH endonuclease signature motif containing protein [Paeniglutamicibacter psychrophenolicus]|uniref:HNH endonuclease signature motif containing protein n=1 Tax=Paeniglutamicibacter psychrophenolicus TaxID=257454 RepID=UPI00277F3096|nr:HNH endonuclease signature motif containing protein [Paeniglutamicibacter psychrophenolicus]MDQ0094590.1 hypothetical protein [Paeniglutamicibacter psychrophenolicus]
MTTTAPTATPRGQADTDTAIRQLAAAVLAVRAAQQRLGSADLDAASAALVLGLYEQGNRSIAYGQMHAVFTADALQVHRLDPGTAAQVDALAADPCSLSDGTANVPVERMCQGMAAHRNTNEWMQAHLHITEAESKRRLGGSRLLIAPAQAGSAADDGGRRAPVFPILAQAAEAGQSDVGTLAQLAKKLSSLQPRLALHPEAPRLAADIEASVAEAVTAAEPRHGYKALADWDAFLTRNGAPITDAQIRAKRGFFYKYHRDGCDIYQLSCDPVDSEAIRAFGEAWTNPRSSKLPPSSVSTRGPVTRTDTRPDANTPSATTHDTAGTAAADPATADPAAEDPAAADPAAGAPGTAGVEPPQDTGAPGAPEGFGDPAPGDSTTKDATPDGWAPAGAPAPEWALAPGADPELAPRSEWSCGPPAPGTGDNAPGSAEELQGWEDRDSRTAPQLLLDGLIAAITGALNGTGVPDSGGLPVKIGVLIGYRSLLGQCEDAGITAHGTPISAANIRRLACDADLLPALLGSAGEILDLGRTVRGFTPAQRRAIAIRDRGCVVPGCHRPASTNEYHHVKPWQEGGETSVDNGANTCQHHHLMIHAGLITLKMINGIPYVVGRAGQPRGDPERNLYWHPELRTAGYTPPMFTD